MEVMDAGIRDNFGWKTTYRFVYALREWIENHTSGVVIVQVRDLPGGAVGVEGEVRRCSDFQADPGRWARLRPGEAVPA